MRPADHVQAHHLGTTAAAVRTDRGWEAEVDERSDRLDPAGAAHLLGELVVAVAHHGGGTLRWRVAAPSDEHRRAAHTHGFDDRRRLFQLRRELPLPWSTDLATRAFNPDTDVEAWLEVNNAAFDWHPEQSRQTAEDLATILAEPWFDANGFLVHPVAGPMKGFCWTKVHNELDPPVGEIFVIGVHPDHHGEGLGKALVLAGLDHLAQQGLSQAMLYTEADNLAALGMYQALGFEVDHEIVVFERQIESI